MSDLRMRLRTRAYLGLTGIFYLLNGVAYSSSTFLMAAHFQPGPVWPCAFILAGILSLFGWVGAGYKTGRHALYVAASVAAGFSTLFITKIAGGEIVYLAGAAVWAYIASAHITIARLPDPFVLALFESEVKKLEQRLARTSHE